MILSWRVAGPVDKTRVPHPSFLGCGGVTLLFSRSSRISEAHSLTLIAVQPSISIFRCKTLNIFIKVCYSLLWLFTLSLEAPPCCLAKFLILSQALALSSIFSHFGTHPLRAFPFLFIHLRGPHFATPLFSWSFM
jgi:hypothetical protein